MCFDADTDTYAAEQISQHPRAGAGSLTTMRVCCCAHAGGVVLVILTLELAVLLWWACVDDAGEWAEALAAAPAARSALGAGERAVVRHLC
jgi:hypothetical protein